MHVTSVVPIVVAAAGSLVLYKTSAVTVIARKLWVRITPKNAYEDHRLTERTEYEVPIDNNVYGGETSQCVFLIN